MPINPTILFAGGGSGGHIYPNLAVVERLVELGVSVSPYFLVSERAVDRKILDKEALIGSAVPALPLAMRPDRLWQFYKAYKAAEVAVLDIIERTGAKAMLATGGFVSGPSVSAAAKAGLPVALVSLDAVPGKSNRWSARTASDVFSAYETEQLKRAQLISVPLRRSVVGDKTQAKARWELGLKPELETLLVFGGSQGGGTINEALAELVSRSTAKDLFAPRGKKAAGWQVMHLTGEKDRDEVAAAYAEYGVPGRVEAYCNEMGLVWSAASLCICRSGAGSVAESWANHVPCLYLPYPFHKDEHQRANAAPVVNRGGGLLLKDRIEVNANVDELLGPLRSLMQNNVRREQMVQVLKDSCPPDGAGVLADWLLGVTGLAVRPMSLLKQ